MSKYLFLFRGGMDMRAATPDALQASMMKWKQWMDELVKNGKMLSGEPLDGPGKVLTGTAKKITDGPFAEGKEVVGGYMMIEASGMDEALELSKGCPVLDHEGSVEVRPVMEMRM
ncbi:MAG: hypothetical protein IT229_04585 [Flavobacteriales bacterium]|nr:hypothetical protein [Flavobacteriales bacterium]